MTQSENQPISSQQGSVVFSQKNVIRTVNAVLTTFAMFSIGLLASLQTHEIGEKQGWSSAVKITMDTGAFTTAVVGKAAIILDFDRNIVEGIEKILRNETPNFFKLNQKSLWQQAGWLLNILMTLNVCVFWSGLTQVSFTKSGELLQRYNSTTAQSAGDLMKNPLFSLFFVFCSFYSNACSWPNIHAGGYQLLLSFLKWFTQTKEDHLHEREKLSKIGAIQRIILLEIKNAIYNPSSNFPMIKQLGCEIGLEKSDLLIMLKELSTTNAELLKKACDSLSISYTSESLSVYYIKRFISFAFSVLCAYGFRNLLGLTATVWGLVGMESVAQYGPAYLGFFSIIILIFLTAYPMINNLLDLSKGFMPDILSKTTLAFIFGMVFFIGLCGALPNAEQSRLDGESSVDIITALIGCFAIESSAIYSISRGYVERPFHQPIDSKDNRDLQLKKYFCLLEEKFQEISVTDEPKTTSVLSLFKQPKEEEKKQLLDEKTPRAYTSGP